MTQERIKFETLTQGRSVLRAGHVSENLEVCECVGFGEKS